MANKILDLDEFLRLAEIAMETPWEGVKRAFKEKFGVNFETHLVLIGPDLLKAIEIQDYPEDDSDIYVTEFLNGTDFYVAPKSILEFRPELRYYVAEALNEDEDALRTLGKQ